MDVEQEFYLLSPVNMPYHIIPMAGLVPADTGLYTLKKTGFKANGPGILYFKSFLALLNPKAISIA